MELDLTGAACIVFQHGSSGRVNIITAGSTVSAGSTPRGYPDIYGRH